jgi:hypothetical protein
MGTANARFSAFLLARIPVSERAQEPSAIHPPPFLVERFFVQRKCERFLLPPDRKLKKSW